MIQIETTSHDPFFNQAFEDYVFRTFREDEVLLLWRNRPAVVVGCYQNICREVHVRALLEQNVPVVRRMSGGGTVYHDLGNLNYTLITGQSGALDYDRCLAPVLRALNALGVPAQKSRTCDMTVDGKKISGSAQKIANGRVLHHGTLLFDADLTRLDEMYPGAAALEGDDCASIAEMLHQLSSLQRSEGEKEYSYLVKQALLLMNHDLREKTSLEDVAGRLGISAGYFSHIFSEEVGESPVSKNAALSISV